MAEVEEMTFEKARELIEKTYDDLIYPSPINSREEAYNDGLTDFRDGAIREFRFGL